MPLNFSSARDDVVRRFVDACHDDARIEAAFIGGSSASGTADSYADIDLYLILADDAYDAFFVERDAFVDRLGTTVFRETLNIGFDVVAFIMDHGVDGEVILHRASGVDDLHTGPILPVLDRAGILRERSFPVAYPTPGEIAVDLPVVLAWFWRDLLHITRAIARDRLWTAWAFLGKLRDGCAYLLVLAQERDRPADRFVPFDGYEALDHIPASPELEMLRASLCLLERDAMVASARTLVDIYERIGPEVAARHGLDYPAAAATVVRRRLDALDEG